MEYSGPGSLTDIEADLALSDEDDVSHQHWPELVPHNHRKGPPVPDAAPRAMDHAPINTKRRMEPDSDTNSDPVSPAAKRPPVSDAAKTSRCTEAATVHEAPDPSLPRLINLTEPSVAVQSLIKDHSWAPPPRQLPPPQRVLSPPPLRQQPWQDPHICSCHQRFGSQARNSRPPNRWDTPTGPASTRQ
ncbi:hypothetical protein Pcinc_015315 [Petrolisthes cinctipes]|uniref:Uncharacterized protein n=1 Tax=Petrolisthes cinctipes TaxID=88211 RepID=A0AAE1FTB0_PETCI|nr:hypothetical protein Pcinc_015315 [Petrolisthes cinctipes]